MDGHEFKGWKDELQSLINKHNATRVNGRVASNKTQADRASFLFKAFYDLREMGYAVSPHNIKQKHIQVLCKLYESQKLSPATLQTYLMHLRVFTRWIGKSGMIGKTNDYFSSPEVAKRIYAAKEDKSWSGNGVSIKEKLDEIKVADHYLWIQLLVQAAFGLRAKEVLSLRPYMNFRDNTLQVVDGAKGNKNRVIPVETELQQIAVREANLVVGKTSNQLKHPGNELKKEYNLYYRLMRKFGLTKDQAGVTGHGLRHEFTHAFMMSFGLVPSVKGEQVEPIDPDKEKQVRLEVSQRLGHNRVGITTAYSGRPQKKIKK